jgi:hypothetical protein
MKTWMLQGCHDVGGPETRVGQARLWQTCELEQQSQDGKTNVKNYRVVKVKVKLSP